MIRFKRREDVDTREIVRLYEEGFTCSEIAERLSTSKTLVLKRLDEAGIERRPRGWKRPEFRFWRKVAKRGPVPFHAQHLGECWEWQGGTRRGKHKYGVFLLNGKVVYAHRFAWELANGPIPEGLSVCHSCDNEKCVRAAHLWLGTLADNNLDRNRKGRQARGERMAAAKLSAESVELIRYSNRELKIPQRRLARVFGVARSRIAAAVKCRTWRHVKTLWDRGHLYAARKILGAMAA